MTAIQTPLRSLRGRLIGALSLAVAAAVILVAGLHHLAAAGTGLVARTSRLLLGDELPEPWQDVAVLLPFSVVVLVLASLVSLWSLRPLVRASQEARAVGPARPEARIGVRDLPAEVAPLVGAVNDALDRLARAFEAERRFTQDAAHELRTPLASLGLRLQRARLDGAPDWPAIERDLAQMKRLVAQLLDLARKDRTLRTARDGRAEQVNLSRVAREAAALILPLVEAQGRVLEVDAPHPVIVRGDADDLRDMTRNLLENALAHGRGRIALRCVATSRAGGGDAVLDVGDEGRGVAPELREAVFERFRKGPGASDGGDGGGSGLGLAIARAVAIAHAGSLGFVDGPGCRLRVTLPLATAPAAPRREAGPRREKLPV